MSILAADASITASGSQVVCELARAAVAEALTDCARPATSSYVAAGLIAWDDCCGMLVAAPERVYQTATFPIEGPDPQGCYDGLIAVNIVVLLMRCVPVLDDSGHPPTAEAMNAAYSDLLADAGIVWNTMWSTAGWLPHDWPTSGLSQTFVGAEGGCIGVETRLTVGLDADLFCACPLPAVADSPT